MSDNNKIEVNGEQVDLVYKEDGGARGPELKRRLRATPDGNGNLKVALIGERGGKYSSEITVNPKDLRKWAQIAESASAEDE